MSVVRVSPVAAASRDLVDLWVRGWSAARSGGLGVYGRVVAALWVFGIVGDAVTTVSMMRSDLSEEGNPAAVLGMGVLGLEGYCVAVSLVCLALMLPTLVLPRRSSAYQVAAWSTLLLVGAGKVYIVLSNAALAASVLGMA